MDVNKAKEIVLRNSFSLPEKYIDLENAEGFFLAENCLAPISQPLFNQSTVDGYAIRHVDLGNETVFQIAGQVKAGDPGKISINKNEAIRIFTGGKVPDDADIVIMQEHVDAYESKIRVSKNGFTKGNNIRKKGQQITQGEIALRKGTALTPSAIGFLASLGIKSVKTYATPRVCIIITGNEFADPDFGLSEGKIYESNGLMLKTILLKNRISSEIFYCADDIVLLKKMIRKQSEEADLILITGGISVGNYDFTLSALQHNDFKILFHGVRQKPGKPLLFGKKENCAAFGLPGNPRATMICFYEYALPFIKKIMGSSNPGPLEIALPLKKGYAKPEESKTYFLAGSIANNEFEIAEKQDSGMLKSLATANGIGIFPAGQINFKTGEPIVIHLL